ncbi:MAG: xanthine dehydrogenase family protein [Candidatus Rokubacteria bacterium]|nr:xanthine dehydrogenase family protein [Candidatus Rokubacteria bacterium]
MGYVGQSVRRREDERFIQGAGRFVGDVDRPGMLHVAVLRSPHAHARIVRLDASRARSAPGVVDVLTYKDAPALHRPIPMRMSDRGIMSRFLQYPLAQDRVRYVGDPIAVVAADDRYRAEDALDRIEVEYEALPAVVDARAAAAGSPLLFEAVGTNVAASFRQVVGDIESAIREAHAVVRETFDVQRHTAVPMETRGVMAEWDSGRRVLELWGMTKVPYFSRTIIADHLGLPEHGVHIHQIDVGGAFGVRGELYPEDFLVPVLAMRRGRPVKWVEDRREHLMATNHSRQQHHEVLVALRRDGVILGLDDRFWTDMGAYVRTHGATAPNNTAAYLAGPYRIPNYRVEAACVVTNKTPTGTYRGPGRFEANFVRERVIDVAARATGIDPAEIRSRNFVTSDAMPYEVGTTTLGRKVVFDSGDFPRLFRRALDRFGYASLREEQMRARASGRYLGIGLAYVVEKSGLGPWEAARVTVATGVPSVGQGVETVFAQICADALSVSCEDVTVRYGDTDLLPGGGGAFASRGTVMGGNAVLRAAERVREKILLLAGHELEAHPKDLELREGRVQVKGVPDRTVSLRELAKAATVTRALAAGREPGLEALEFYEQEKMTYGHGAHLVQVEIDPQTGLVTILRYMIDHDIGRAINPLLVDGQIVGGTAQGLGAALKEDLVYAADGQLLTATLMDYALPTATDVPPFEIHLGEDDLSPVNPLGVKGAGEDGTVGAGAAIANAVADALGVTVRSLPLTPSHVLALLREAQGAR